MNDIMEKVSESETDGEAVENFSARPYQVELLERAKERNTIVCLGTGTGKTFISVMLIKELAHEVRGNYKEGGRRTFFVVNTGTYECFVFLRSALPGESGYDISAGGRGCSYGSSREPSHTFKYPSKETELRNNLIVDLSLFLPDYDTLELLLPGTKI